jgi:hypothetical protein
MSRASPAEHRAPQAHAARRAVCAWLGLSLLGAAGKGRVRRDVDRAGLSIAETRRADGFLGKRLDDRELARLVERAAKGRLQAAKKTSVPQPLELAQPHLLLMLDHCERAASAAALGEPARHARHTGACRVEEELFRSVLRQLGWSLPVRS